MYKNISCIWPKMRRSLGRVWMVDLLVAVRVLPLQFASLLLVTLPLTMPRLLALQLANPASVVEGAQSKAHQKCKLHHGCVSASVVGCISAACYAAPGAAWLPALQLAGQMCSTFGQLAAKGE